MMGSVSKIYNYFISETYTLYRISVRLEKFVLMNRSIHPTFLRGAQCHLTQNRRDYLY